MLFDIKLALNKKINSSLTCFILLDKDVTMCGFFVLETQNPDFLEDLEVHTRATWF